MKFALQTLPNGATQIVEANGNPLGKRDADRPILHVLPKLLVPAAAVLPSAPFQGLECENITLEVTSTLPISVVPDGGAIIRQPYPNRRYFVGGSTMIRNGWIVTLPLDVTEFDIQFRWLLEGPGVWRTVRQDEWEVRHLLHIRLHPGKGMTYSMDSACWPERNGPSMHSAPISLLGIEEDGSHDRSRRQIVKDSDLIYQGGEQDGELAGYFLEETVDITGIALDQAWTIDAFQDEQIHEVRQSAIFQQDNDSHQLNGPVEMPSDLFLKAVKLAEEVPFGDGSDFGKAIAGVPGGMERHPAMQLLCAWWATARPDGEPFRPGSAMPMVRVRDDGEYWWGYHEIPNAPIKDFNTSGRDVARIGNLMLVLFQATQDVATFDHEGMHTFLPSGEPYNTVGIGKESYLSGESDEAWYCMDALASFRTRFPAAWKFLNKTGEEYRMARRSAIALEIHESEDPTAQE